MKINIDWKNLLHGFLVVLWMVVKTVLLVLLQAFIYETAAEYYCAPSQLLGACGFGGPSGGIMSLTFSFCFLILCFIYTLVGSILERKYGLFSRKFNKHFMWWYLAYFIISSAGFIASTRAWFWEGFGWYLVDVLLAPFFLLTIMAIFIFILRKIRKARSKDTQQQIDETI